MNESDIKFVKKIEKQYARRRKLALYFGVLGLISVVSFIYFNQSYVRYADYFTEPRRMITALCADEKYLDLYHDEVKEGMNLSLVIGKVMGQALNMISVMSGLLICLSINCLFGMRRERVLLKLYSELNDCVRKE